ncbi:tetratricopeptide repeat protein [Catenovulum agarivorans]|uniref:tetratricopeptide repeat protein n=1 Tax=Catenovulum agarivorans TaxID=1172192 RepID=UPI0002ED9B39|nr:SEL1-like repeat protein [Catenovulum agarivorans]
MEFTKKTTLAATLIIGTFSFGTCAADLLKANTLFKQQQYTQAAAEYKQGAKLGSAHSYYQLGLMYAKGLGVQQDQLNALIYLNLAAQQNYHDAANLLNKMTDKLPAAQLELVQQALQASVEQQAQATSIYLPQINHANLNKKFTFEGEAELEKKVYLDDLQDELDLGLGQDFSDSFESDGDEFSDSSDIPLITVKTPFLILEHEVAPDGSIRYITEIQKLGSVNRYTEAYKLFPLPKPTFDGKPAEFIHRGYIGAAIYDKFDLSDERSSLYREVRNIARKGKDSQDLTEQYQFAMAMLNFPWLEESPGQAEKLLLKLAKQGHPLAMYEYGLKLYREQKNIPQAIRWIAEASKYGLARAEYRLARFIQTSPWLVNDEEKALFWYESAMEKEHKAATIRAAEIKLLANNESLRNVDTGIKYLEMVADTQTSNPEYFYLLALSYKDREARDFKKVVENLEKAIRMADRANWDVSEWEDLLSELTTGRVLIVE